MTEVYWLVEIVWDGEAIRLSTDELDVLQADGTPLHFKAAFDELEVEEAISSNGDSAGQLSVPLEFVSPVSIAARAAQGGDLSAARGEISRWVRGTTYEERRVVLSGRLVDPEYGSDEEAVSCSIEESSLDDETLIPAATAAVSSETSWAISSLPEAGAVGPVVFGSPGKVSTDISSSGWITGSPAVWIDYRKTVVVAATQYAEVSAVIAWHHVASERVWVNTTDFTSGARLKVLNTYDDLGQPIAVLPWFRTASDGNVKAYSPAATYSWSLAEGGGTTYGLGVYAIGAGAFIGADDPVSLFVGWYDDVDETGGGLVWGGKVCRDAGDVIEYLLSQSSLAVDWGRVQAAKPLLARFKVDGVISDRIGPLEFLQQEIAPLLPVSLCSGPAGIYPVVWQYAATVADARVALDADTDPEVSRVDRVQIDSEDVANKIRVKYAYSYRTQAYCGSVTFGAASDTDATPNQLCDLSRKRTGKVYEKEISTAYVYDTVTAYAIAEWQALAFANPRRTISYQVPESEYTLERGDVVTLTDSELYLDRQVCIVQTVLTDGTGYLTVTLYLLDAATLRHGGA